MKILLLFSLAVLLGAAERRSRGLLRELGQPTATGRRLLPDLAALAALVLLFWPAPPADPAPPSGPALALAVDVSASMAAEDTPPSRLERARTEIRALVAGLPQARFALLPFAGEPVLQVPLTADREAVLFFVDRLAPGTVGAPGSAPEEAVSAAAGALSEFEGEKAIVLFSDGERTVSEPAPVLTAGIPVHVVPLGTDAGSPIMDDKGRPRRDAEGKILLTRSDTERLHRMAETTGGEMLGTGSPAVGPLLERLAPSDHPREYPGRSPLLLPAILILLLRHLPFSLRRLRLGASLALLLLFLPLTACEDGQSRQGRELFARAGRLELAGETDGAMDCYARAADLLEGEERAAALYNRGTLLLVGGSPREALSLLEEAMILSPGDDAIRLNMALTLRALGEPPFPGVGDGGERNADGEGSGMSREEALQLLENIRPAPDAPAAVARAQVRDKTPERDW